MCFFSLCFVPNTLLAHLRIQIYQVEKLDPLVRRALAASSAVPDLGGKHVLLWSVATSILCIKCLNVLAKQLFSWCSSVKTYFWTAHTLLLCIHGNEWMMLPCRIWMSNLVQRLICKIQGLTLKYNLNKLYKIFLL